MRIIVKINGWEFQYDTMRMRLYADANDQVGIDNKHITENERRQIERYTRYNGN